MTNPTLLQRAKKDLQLSQNILRNAQDELDYEISGYHLQQALEKTMKFYMEIKGVPYRFVHDIAILFDTMDKANLSPPEWIFENSALLSSYESKTRYGNNLVVVKRELTHFQSLTEQYLAHVESQTITDTPGPFSPLH